MTIRRELIDELLKEYETPQVVLGEGGLLKELTKAVIERCLESELDTHLGYPKHERKGSALGNMRNGQSQKTLKGEQGHIEIDVPRDRQGTFEPQLVKKRLALCADRTAKSGGERYFHYLRRWVDRLT